ncbi:Hypothetical protein D9617_25g061000 [Elsinoe fawcettii]|nr:Hypothetical protein D9617_25g061000 [Elsinoe fawcettii]
MADPVQHIEVERAVVDTGPSLDETFDQLLGEAEEEEEGVQLDTGAGPRSIEARNEPAFTQTIVERDPGAQRAQDGEQRDPGAERELLHEPTHSHIAGNVMQATGSRQIQTRRIAALRRELGRMRTGLERVSIALRELGETPETAQSTEELSQLDRSLADIVQRNQDSGPRSLEEAISEVRPEDRLQRATTWLQERRNERQNAERQIAELEAHSVRAQRHRMALESKAEDLRIDILQAQLQTERWRQEGRSAENFRRVFGTREDMDREDWVSPINQMFTRAYDRFRDAEQARRENRTPPIWGLPPPAPGRARAETPVSQPSLNHTRQGTRPNEGLTSRLAREQEDLAMQESLQQYYQDMIPSQRRDVDIETPNPQFDPYSVMDETATEETIRGFDRLTFRSNGEAEITPFSDLPSLDLDLARWRVPPDFPLDPANHPFIRETPPAYRATHAHPHHAEEERGLDADKTRPDPKSDGDMTVKLDCKVCYTQAADTACLPCGHLVMCRWCSEQHSPSLKHDRTTPADERAQCPVCRKVVKKKVRVRLG